MTGYLYQTGCRLATLKSMMCPRETGCLSLGEQEGMRLKQKCSNPSQKAGSDSLNLSDWFPKTYLCPEIEACRQKEQ